MTPSPESHSPEPASDHTNDSEDMTSEDQTRLQRQMARLEREKAKLDKERSNMQASIKKQVKQGMDEAMKEATTLTAGQLQAAVNIGQIREDLKNVEPPHVGTNRGPNKFLPRPIIDEFFRDRQNNILNSGQAYYFTFLKFRWFLDTIERPPPFVMDTPIPKPAIDYSPAQKLLMTPIGIISDRVEPRFSKKDRIFRAGTIAYLRALPPRDNKDPWQVVDSNGSFVELKLIWTTGGITKENFPAISRRSKDHYRQELQRLRNSYEREFEQWARYQRVWEWTFFQKARTHHTQLRWPKGTTPEDIIAATESDVISPSPIMSRLTSPNVIPGQEHKEDYQVLFEMLMADLYKEDYGGRDATGNPIQKQ
jgi:hypothetical protein